MISLPIWIRHLGVLTYEDSACTDVNDSGDGDQLSEIYQFNITEQEFPHPLQMCRSKVSSYGIYSCNAELSSALNQIHSSRWWDELRKIVPEKKQNTCSIAGSML